MIAHEIELIKQMLEAVSKMRKKNKETPEPDPLDYDTWCMGNPYYEEFGPGDGVNVAYFPDEAFDGQPTKTT